VDSPERDCAKLEIDALANRQPVQLPPKLSDTGTTWRLNYLSYYTERASSEHAEDGRVCAATNPRAERCNSRDVHQR